MAMNNTIVVDFRIYPESVDKLQKLGYDVVKFKARNYLDVPVSAHPDMCMAKIKDKVFLDNAVNDAFTFIKEMEFCNREEVDEDILKYPFDVAFNCVQFGKYLLCNKNYTHKSIISYAIANNIEIINTKQGYAKCSTCVVSDNAIITEDDNVAYVCKEKGVDVLKIQKGFVKLDGYDYGFFGGCSGLVEKNLLVFNGNVELHPNYNEIAEFCRKYNVNTVSLSENALYDIGSIIKL